MKPSFERFGGISMLFQAFLNEFFLASNCIRYEARRDGGTKDVFKSSAGWGSDDGTKVAVHIIADNQPVLRLV